jgi:exodeoxyribonuclease-3
VRLATWNVNSIRVRKERVLAWLTVQRPDVLCLQETKVTDEVFPHADCAALGYRVALSGQRTYNGVAILARTALKDVVRCFDDGEDEADARFLAATVGQVRVICVYVPNGQVVGSERFAYKLRWLRRLRWYLDRYHSPQDLLALCGDFNVAPEPRDVHDPDAWADTVLFHPDARTAFNELIAWGLRDAIRLHHQEGGLYSWWDYRQLAFPRNHGLRIDHVLVTAPLAAQCTGARIDRDARKGQGASDHAPVVAEFTD